MHTMYVSYQQIVLLLCRCLTSSVCLSRAGSTRRVRCSGERPACAACIKHATWQGHDNHGCFYRDSKEEVERDKGKEQQEVLTELQAARRRIGELELKLGMYWHTFSVKKKN